MDAQPFIDEANAIGEAARRAQAETLRTSQSLMDEAKTIAAHTGLSIVEALRRLVRIYGDKKLAEAKASAVLYSTVVTDVDYRADGVIEVKVMPYVPNLPKNPAAAAMAVARARAQMNMAIAGFEILQGFGRRPVTALPILAMHGAVPR